LPPSAVPRVGLVWRGSRESASRAAIALVQLAPLLATAGVTFHALQKDVSAEERLRLGAYDGVSVHADALDDFVDTAAALERMDLVITIDTAVAHLAGALGRPTWLLLSFTPDWRWLLERMDSPWYPTMRLFRQPRFGDWDAVVAAVTQALGAWAGGSVRTSGQ
jgi:ADP-heptose:LPS heptosyltransferase